MVQFNLDFCDYAFHNAVLLFKTGYYWTDVTKNNDQPLKDLQKRRCIFFSPDNGYASLLKIKCIQYNVV